MKRSTVEGKGISVTMEDQAHAAYLASEAFVREIKSCGHAGNRLHAMVLTLGELFAFSQQRRTQSEPEVSHFAFSSATDLERNDQILLDEAVKWSVLFEEKETKGKDINPHPVQWVLNPVYAPYFGITYRKIRKLDLTAQDVHVLLNGNYDERKNLLKRFQKKWDQDETQESNQPFLPGME